MATQQVSEASIRNGQMLDRLRAAQAAAESLTRKGFVLASIEVGARNPVVWVEHTRACDGLQGALIMRCATCSIVATVIDGVQVQWQQRRLAS
jgi:hypothetical protein